MTEYFAAYKPEEIEKLDEKDRIDFLPRLQPGPDAMDRKILESWMNHFIGLDVPFIVIETECNWISGRKLTLWKYKYPQCRATGCGSNDLDVNGECNRCGWKPRKKKSP